MNGNRLLHYRHLLTLAITLILIAGLAAWSSLPRIEDPRITTRNATIITALPGSTAERVEALVTKKLENALREVAEIKTVESSSRGGISVISVELDEWATKARDLVAIFSEETCGGVAVDLVFDESRYTSARLGELRANLGAPRNRHRRRRGLEHQPGPGVYTDCLQNDNEQKNQQWSDLHRRVPRPTRWHSLSRNWPRSIPASLLSREHGVIDKRGIYFCQARF